MERIDKTFTKAMNRPIKVLQFGEGNFLRAFVDYMIDITNNKGLFNGNIAIVKPISYGSLDLFKQQECQFTVSLRGINHGETIVMNHIITSISDAVGAYEEYERYAEYANLDSLRFIVSNTTEAGIVFDDTDAFDAKPPKTYPGKLTKLLYDRFTYYNGDKSKGLIIIPCELIEDNGGSLKRCIRDYAILWNLSDNFLTWIDDACIFCSTLVDRIVTGYPKDEDQLLWNEFGYEDKLLVTGELFGLWVIESDKDISKEFPLDQAKLPVIFTNNQKPYRERKVRILNGAHTSFVLASYLAGNDYVLEVMKDLEIKEYMQQTIFDEIIPTLTLPQNELITFANSVIERFENPYIKHALLSISLNSVSKWKTRCLPSFRSYVDKFGMLPKNLTFSLASLLCFYRSNKIEEDTLIGVRGEQTYKIIDDLSVLEYFAHHSEKPTKNYVLAILSNQEFFGEDMTRYHGLVDEMIQYINQIDTIGMRETIKELNEKKK
ncbi:MAG: Mannitol dehydrogenase domain [Anaerocolumna sp.]|jgi:tagaturonate reductase|nr:Mannitol dehydrogenase domain [Anaerocolumna sp.]